MHHFQPELTEKQPWRKPWASWQHSGGAIYPGDFKFVDRLMALTDYHARDILLGTFSFGEDS
jgi:hypothetical protein